jgi:hypothetical protein
MAPQDEPNARRVLPWLDAEDHHRAHRVLLGTALTAIALQAVIIALLILGLLTR